LLTPYLPFPQLLSLAVACLWLLVAIRTAIASASGNIFFAPCVAEYEKERIKEELDRAGMNIDEKFVAACMA
jgi:hypothetical protein